MTTHGVKIVIAEDDPLLMRAYHEAFVQKGYEVDSFFNADDAYDAIRTMSIKPALILSDIMMPKTNGLQFLEKIRASDMKDVPFVLLTSLSQKVHEEKAQAMGVTAYLVKDDFSIKALVERVESLLTDAS